ncbi:MAG: hypothetical protein HPY68_10485 [Candidatus Atribacteria bacterium]|nr:hypothetical protein [Candidatus Atribacteria bacterium]
MHAGDGLMQGGDWLYFHRLAKDLAERIRLEGWYAWELRPEGQAPAGIAAIFYVFFGPRPWVMLPLNALVHAFGGLVLFLIMQDFVKDRKRAFISVLPFVFFPSAMLWYTQMHKDGMISLGVFLFLWGWERIIQNQREDWSFLLSSMGVLAGGVALVWIVRPYVVEILWGLSFLVALILSAVFVALRRKHCLWRINLLLFWLVVVGLTLVVQVDTPGNDIIGDPKEAVGFPWFSARWLPGSIDGRFKAVAMVREAYRFIDPEAMGNVDWEVTFHSAGDIIRYIPRALTLGFLAPFPGTWVEKGVSLEGVLRRRVTGLEMLVVYCSLLLFSLSLWRWRKNPAFWTLVFYSLSVILVYALSFPNLGPLYRERYGFLMVFVAFGLVNLKKK